MTKEQLKQCRIDLGLSLSDAAKQVHVRARTWARYESGERSVPECIIHLFCILNKLDYV